MRRGGRVEHLQVAHAVEAERAVSAAVLLPRDEVALPLPDIDLGGRDGAVRSGIARGGPVREGNLDAVAEGIGKLGLQGRLDGVGLRGGVVDAHATLVEDGAQLGRGGAHGVGVDEARDGFEGLEAEQERAGLRGGQAQWLV